MERAALQATPAFIKNHRRVFERAVYTLDYPIAQNTSVGFVRSPLDRQKLVDYMTKLTNDSIRYGQVRLAAEDKNQRKQIILSNLRAIAFAK